MSRRAFDCYLVQVGMGTHPKLARLSDAEFRAHVVGVLAVAAMSPIRGRLLVGDLNAEAVDIARAAGVSKRVAQSAMRKLEALGILELDSELGCLFVHDWSDLNPEPRRDSTNADRQKRLRERRRNGESNGTSNAPCNGTVTGGEVEVEVEGSPSARTAGRAAPTKHVDQDTLPDDFPAVLAAVATGALTRLVALQAERGGMVPTLRGVGLTLARFPDRDVPGVLGELEHWSLAGRGQARAIKDWPRTLGSFLERSPAGKPPIVAVPSAGRARAELTELDRRRLDSARRLMGEAQVA